MGGRSLVGLGQHKDMCKQTSDHTHVSRCSIAQLFRTPQSFSQPAVRTVLDLKPHEVQTYLTLVDHPQSSASDLADFRDRQRSHIATDLRRLIDIGLITRLRHQHDAGQDYRYEPVGLDDTKRVLHYHVDQWTASVRSEIDALGDGNHSNGSE